MKAALPLSLLVVLSACPPQSSSKAPPPPEPVEDPARYADPRMGTGGFGFNFGSAFPGAAAPNGFVKAGPDTSGEFGTVNFLHYTGYWYGDDTVLGFSHMHLHGTGATDYGIISVMPTANAVGSTIPTVAEHQSRFRKETEVAEPGYYAVTLDRGDIRAELTATTRAAHHRHTFPADATEGHIILDLDRTLNGGQVTGAELTLDPDRQRISGRVQHVGQMSGGFGGYEVFFELRARTRWTSHRVWRAGVPPEALDEIAGTHVGAVLTFDVSSGEPIELQLGLSYVSAEGARANLEAELPSWEFDGTRASTYAAWRSLLSAIRIFGGTETERRTFYSNLHHSYMMPSITSDVDNRYRGHDGMNHTADGFQYVTDLSLWDTYRTLHPLYVLIAPSLAVDVVKSLHAMAEQGGAFPKWPLGTGEAGTMIGASAEIIVADTYVKGLTGFDANGAYDLLRAAAMDMTEPAGGRGGRNHVEPYMTLGYVPQDRRPSVSLTTEYAHSDFALSEFARALGRAQDADALLTRSRGYRALFDPATGFLRPRDATGQLTDTEDFSDTLWTEDYAEANAWQSVWMAAHDVDGLAALFGGPEAMVAKLIEFFEKSKADQEALDPENYVLNGASPRPYYFHGNEPDIHAAYLFAQLGRRDLMATWVHWIRTMLYNDGPDGLNGNDDGGTLGAWYVFSALGFYPLPGSDRYILGTPMFPRAEITVDGGVFTIEAENAGGGNIHIQSVELNGVPFTANEFRHSELRAGGTLRFVMGSTPP